MIQSIGVVSSSNETESHDQSDNNKTNEPKHKVKEIKIPKSKFKPLLESYRESLVKLKEEMSKQKTTTNNGRNGDSKKNANRKFTKKFSNNYNNNKSFKQKSSEISK